LIATAFKEQLKAVRNSLKDINVLQTKSKFDSKKNVIDAYKNGLRKDMVTKGER